MKERESEEIRSKLVLGRGSAKVLWSGIVGLVLFRPGASWAYRSQHLAVIGRARPFNLHWLNPKSLRSQVSAGQITLLSPQPALRSSLPRMPLR